ncbi:MAG: gliding motility-associated C-terminal domain-containing protein, partial [Bacteroidota bacterium]
RGVNLGYVVRDMQILIEGCSNLPPVIHPVNDTCVLAGDSIGFFVTAIDPNGNRVVLSASGGPFQASDSAFFTAIQFNNDTAVSQFSWNTSCDLVRSQPYYVQFKAQDVVPLDSVPLVSLEGAFIYIYGPPPPSLTAIASGNSITLDWQPSGCGNVIGYRIYRRNGAYPGGIPCPCDNGAPGYSGYQLLAVIDSASILTYEDDNQGAGLSVGIDYCYIVTAIYPDGAESCASPQACASLKRDLPVLTNVDVTATDPASGSIYVAWSKPTELDTLLFPPPYKYVLKRSSGFTTSGSVVVAQFNDLNDTIFNDNGLGTESAAFTYQVELLYTSAGSFVSKGTSTPASSIFLLLSPTDNRITLSWNVIVPWNNVRFDVFRSDSFNGLYDSIATVNSNSYTDLDLINGNRYCYFVRSVGSYSIPGFIDPIVNHSQKSCGVPFDNEPPCPPLLQVNSSCRDRLNELVWTDPNNTCANDVVYYNIYFSAGENSGFELIDSVSGATDTFYVHSNLSTVTGCYRVTAVDSAGNETSNPNTVCVDSCRQYVLPSVFTPNGDGVNDIFHPCDETTSLELQQTNCPPYRNVRDVDMRIYNRWGRVVFATTDKDIRWDGNDQESGVKCSDGIYFYTCNVNFFRLNGVETAQLHGTVYLLSSE